MITEELIKRIKKLSPYYRADQEPFDSAENMRKNILDLIENE
jgi:hypothetical protein|tara:strand:- start:1300 stop:1425 length:126 start_codon:yes stop_codon:yes gene_type:complete